MAVGASGAIKGAIMAHSGTLACGEMLLLKWYLNGFRILDMELLLIVA